MDDFRDFYRDALVSRARALKAALQETTAAPGESAAAIRRIAHALRGSGGTYGFPQISAAAAEVEEATADQIVEATDRLLELLQQIATEQPQKQRVLVVDDDPAMALLIEAVLESVGATAHIAGTGAEAEAALLHASFQLIVLDLQLPDTDGRSLLLRLKDQPTTARIPVAILSASATSAVKSECYAIGADAFFAKPIDPQEFAQGMAALLRRKPGAPASAPANDDRRVVLVEDDELAASLIKHRLSRDGFEVVHYADGNSAVELTAAQKPLLIILDVKIPGLDGFEVLRRLREQASLRDIPIVMLTALGNERDVVRAFDLGAADYMTKPFSPAELLARVRRLIAAAV